MPRSLLLVALAALAAVVALPARGELSSRALPHWPSCSEAVLTGPCSTGTSPDTGVQSPYFELTCAPGKHLVGFQLGTGAWLDNIRGLCMAATSDGSWASQSVRDATDGAAGSNGGRWSTTLLCPRDWWVSGLRLPLVWGPSATDYVFDVAAECTGLHVTAAGFWHVVKTGSDYYYTGLFYTGPTGMALSSTPHEASHPVVRFHSNVACGRFGYLATGLYGKAGTWVQSLGLVCDRAGFWRHKVTLLHIAPPDPPAGLSAVATSATRVSVVWKNSDSVLKPVYFYEVDRREALATIAVPGAAGTFWRAVAPHLGPGVHAFSDDTQERSRSSSPTQPFTYRVCAVNTAGWSCSGPVQVKRSTVAPKPQAENLTVTCPSGSVQTGMPIAITGTLTPPQAGVSVVVVLDNGAGVREEKTVTSAADGTFTAGFDAPVPGEWAVTADWVGDTRNASVVCGFAVSPPSP